MEALCFGDTAMRSKTRRTTYFRQTATGQTRPGGVRSVLEPAERIRHGHRLRSGRQDGCSRVIVTIVLRMVLRLCFHVSVKDANTPYRLMEAGQLRENLKLIPDKRAPLQCAAVGGLCKAKTAGGLAAYYLPPPPGRSEFHQSEKDLPHRPEGPWRFYQSEPAVEPPLQTGAKKVKEILD